jgi:Cdc6-like AAA superfamily ATPase
MGRYDPKKNEWEMWEAKVPAWRPLPSMPFHKMIVPTTDTVGSSAAIDTHPVSVFTIRHHDQPMIGDVEVAPMPCCIIAAVPEHKRHLTTALTSVWDASPQVRNAFVVGTLILHNRHTLVTGQTGTGKTVLVQSLLAHLPTTYNQLTVSG